ncbi:MAG: alpha/beta fold hydrolase [Solirubrobacterales bacterium]|nr:alpha/beta fold hydrolase [Solirubrobacterales bacterium]
MYFDLVADRGMNYTLNRALGDGAATSRIERARVLAPKLTDFDAWSEIWLAEARRAEQREQWLDAAHYYHNAEFYLPAGEVRNGLYDDFQRVFAKGMEGVGGYERIEVPYEGNSLPGYRLTARLERATLIAHGGYDSFIEEWYPFVAPLTEAGITVIAFDGPGQGGALRRGVYLTHAWEKPAKAVIDHFGLDEVEWIGASCGGYMALRAAAFEPRIKRVISFPASYWGLDMLLRQATPGQDHRLLSLFLAGERDAVEALVAQQCDPTINANTNFAWAVTQGKHITGTTTAYELMQNLATHSLEGILHRVKQDVLITEGENDHLFPISRLQRVISELACARTVSARVFTAREGAEQHCQVGGSAVAREEFLSWLSRYSPALPKTPAMAMA